MSHDDLERARNRLGATFATGGARYAELRPGYPPAAVAWITEGVPTNAAVADLGAGTGKLTEGLVEAGYAPIAVDPSADMLAQLRARLPGVRTVVGRGEATPLSGASLDLATFAQSWHWVPPAQGAAELARVLRPGGRVAMAWNSFDERVDWLAALSGVWHSTKGAEAIHSRGRRPDLGPGFSDPEQTVVDWVQHTTPAVLAQVVTTRSYYLAAPPDEQQRILAASTALVAEHCEDASGVAVPYRTAVYRATRLAL